MKILIVIPAYNEAKIIKDTLIKVNDFIRQNIEQEYLILV